MTNSELSNVTELQVIDNSKAEQIKNTFQPMIEMLKGFEENYNTLIIDAEQGGIDGEVTERAKRLRIDISKVRIASEKVRKEQKEEYLRAGKAIDGVNNILKWAVVEKENKLKEIENHFEIQEQKRLKALQLERTEKLAPYVEDAHERDLAKFADDEFEALLAMKKKEQEDRIAMEKKAEEERIAKEKAEAEERERIRKENQQLRKEAEERERQAKIESEKRAKEERERQAKAEAERKAREEKERKEREAYEAKLKAERDEKERMQRELEAKAEAERKAREAEANRLQAELAKGDAAKVKDLIADINALKTKYTFKSAKNQKMYDDVAILLGKIVAHIQK